MAAYPQMFVRAHLVPDSGKYRDALRALQDLDEEATDERVAYYRMEDALLRKAGKLLSSKDVSEEDLQKFLELPELQELEAKRQHILERRSHAQKLATDAYDQVDATIQKLDAEMVQLEPQAAMAQPLVGPGSKKKSKKSADKSKLSVQLPLYDPVGRPEDLVIDPNEPLYCVCRKVSFGQMVGCDNDDCQYEWFHFECVGLTERPTGTWYCPDCRKRQSS